jgi:hypothetical protein
VTTIFFGGTPRSRSRRALASPQAAMREETTGTYPAAPTIMPC